MATAAYMPAAQGELNALHKPHHRHWFLLLGVVVLGILLLGIITILIAPSPTTCSSSCPQPPPPRTPAVSSGATYTSPTLGYSVSYDTHVVGSPSNTNATSVGWVGTLSNGEPLDISFNGQTAGGRGADEIVNGIQQGNYADFHPVYPVPGAELGYVPGSGSVFDGTVTPPTGQATHTRLVIMAAIRSGVAVSLVYSTPFEADTGQGFPNPAELDPSLSQFTDFTMNTVTWRGEAPL